MLRFVVWILLLAAVVYAVFWLMDRRSGGGSGPGRGFGGGSRPVRPSGPKGPDDDEEFLRDLDWQRRKASRHQRQDPDHHRSDEQQGHDPSGADDSAEPPHS